MPRVADIYQRPAGIDATPNATIESADYNLNVADVEADLNLPRPVVAGGTGATSAIQARDNLNAEVAMQVITNFDSATWESGSFYADTAAIGSPFPGHSFAGTCYRVSENQDYIVIEARDLFVSNPPASSYIRFKNAGVWGSWYSDGRFTTAGDADGISSTISDMFYGGKISAPYGQRFVVNTEGDASGFDALSVLKNGAVTVNGITTTAFQINAQAASPAGINLQFARNGTPRWIMLAGENTEIGGNAGSDFAIWRLSDAGAFLGVPLSIQRSTGDIVMANTLNVTGPIIGSGGIYSKAPNAGSDAYFILRDSTGSDRGYLLWDRVNSLISVQHTAGDTFSVSDNGVFCGNGVRGRAGAAGAYSGSVTNFFWGPALAAWVDTTNIGNVTVTSDYRTKKDVKDLAGTWDAVKALRPISYTLADWTPAWELEARTKQAAEKGEQITPFAAGDNLERWGFIAHELQDTLLPTAATGHKDAEGIIQSPNWMPVVAALTNALQEAMTRIEALEAAQAAP